jgi:hypothetical protein
MTVIRGDRRRRRCCKAPRRGEAQDRLRQPASHPRSIGVEPVEAAHGFGGGSNGCRPFFLARARTVCYLRNPVGGKFPVGRRGARLTERQPAVRSWASVNPFKVADPRIRDDAAVGAWRCDRLDQPSSAVWHQGDLCARATRHTHSDTYAAFKDCRNMQVCGSSTINKGNGENWSPCSLAVRSLGAEQRRFGKDRVQETASAERYRS